MAIDADRILLALPDGALLVNAHGIVTVANGPARDILQVDAAGLVATAVLRVPAFAPALAAVQQSGEAQIFEAELHGMPSRQLGIHVLPLGSNEEVLVLLRDLTREQAVEKMRSDFVANASHEMRTPLASILGGIETLQGAARNDEKAREQFLATMLSQARRMKRLVDDLLTLSRIELNEHVRPSTTASLTEVAQLASSNLADAARKAGVNIEVTGTAGVEVAGDPDELLQVVQNLLENAIRYGASGGRVEVMCQAEEGRGSLSVRDFGKGIAAIHLPRLTERFYRVSTQESRAQGGTGLGLAIVKHIVLRHRGKLSVSSHEGRGSTFTVSIPLAKS